MKRQRLLLLIFTLLVGLTSCLDHRIPIGAERYRIKSVTIQSIFSSTTDTYTYNGINQVTTHTQFIGSSPKLITYQYDTQGRLISGDTKPVPGLLASRDVYTYDALGRIIQAQGFIGNSTGGYDLVQTFAMEYGTGSFPAKITNIDKSGTILEIFRLTYTDGNVTLLSRTEGSNGAVTNQSLEYDSAPNPFYGLPTSPFTPNISSFNKNIYKVKPMDKATFNNTGLITSLITNYQLAPQLRSTTTYEYESF